MGPVMLDALLKVPEKDSVGLLARTALALTSRRLGGLPPEPHLDDEDDLRGQIEQELRKRLNLRADDHAYETLLALEHALDDQIREMAKPVDVEAARRRLNRDGLKGLEEDPTPFVGGPSSGPDQKSASAVTRIGGSLEVIGRGLDSIKVTDVDEEQAALLLDMLGNRIESKHLANGHVSNIRTLFSSGYLDPNLLSSKAERPSDLLSERGMSLCLSLQSFIKKYPETRKAASSSGAKIMFKHVSGTEYWVAKGKVSQEQMKEMSFQDQQQRN
jgi:hypothetical protein